MAYEGGLGVGIMVATIVFADANMSAFESAGDDFGFACGFGFG